MALQPPLQQHWLSSRSTIQIVPDDGGEDGRRSRDTLFACPYLKRDPDEYAELQSCSEGWTTVDRLRLASHTAQFSNQTNSVRRQHVYRCHILPIKCPGCQQLFESSRLFARHLHEMSHCDHIVSEADGPSKGLETLLQKIRSPKLASANSSEEERWKVLYTTLFPKDPKDNIPYPCK